MRFQATIKQSGKTATGIEVPPAIVEGLGAGKRPAVRVILNGYAYRNTVATMGGVFMLSVSSDVRAAAGVVAGDVVDVDLELDTEPRQVSVPAAFAEALEREPAAKARFDRLSYSGQLRLVQPIAAAKTDATRDRNIAKALAALAG